MTSARDIRLRPFVSLISLIFFVALLRTHTNWGSSLHATLEPTIKASILNTVERTGKIHSSGTGRHVLGLQSLSDLGTVISKNNTSDIRPTRRTPRACEHVRDHVGFPDSCAFVRATRECHSGTVIEYLPLFFCKFYPKAQGVAYILIFVWLMMLFYMLGNTAADYFCCSLEKLSDLLRLPPTVAGVSLLPLGNGAPDVFASIAAFMGTGHSQVGLNSVLGGAVFVTSVVAGSVCLAVQPTSPDTRRVRVDCKCFFRDVGFFLLSLGALSLIISMGKVHFFAAVGYLSIYVLYGITVAIYELIKTRSRKKRRSRLEPALSDSLYIPPSPQSDEEGGSSDTVDELSPITTRWDWQQTYHVAIYSQTSLAEMEAQMEAPVPESETGHFPNGDSTSPTDVSQLEAWISATSTALYKQAADFGKSCWEIADVPLGLPRRLTIPVVEDSARWSQPFAMASATLSPILLAGVWDSNDGAPFGSSPGVYIFGLCIGIILGILAYSSLEKERPPTRWLLPWVIGGFVMSIVWFYLIANELVAVLVALGVILEIDSAILGLTLLAWGNSIGDLISNLALAWKEGDGVQIAISGCYAGPMFNTLVGLGLSFVLASWKDFPNALILPEDNTLIYTIGFLFLSLLWALIVLPARGMAPSKVLGIGLLFLYASFMSLRLANGLGYIKLEGFKSGSGPGFLGVQIL